MTEKALALLTEKKFSQLKQLLSTMNPVDLAGILEEMPQDSLPLVYRLLPKELAAEAFAEMDNDLQEILIQAFSDKELQEVLDELYLDDAVDIIEEMPANVVKRILRQTSPEVRKKINEILHYPEDSAGSIMTTEYVDLSPEWTVAKAMNHIKETGIHKETIYTCYVTWQRKLIGIVSAKDLMTSDDNTLIKDIMETELISVSTHTDQEEVAGLFRKYDLLALPVLDTDNRLVGIVTVDDAMDVVIDEATEDITKMAAVAPSEKTYFETSSFAHAKRRIPWLLVLMFSSIITGSIITKYENAFAAIPLLVSFIPMLMDTGGNSGTQASTMVIRGLALDEIEPRDAARVWFKEIRVALLVSAGLALINFARIAIQYHDVAVAAIVSLTLIATVCIAKSLGCLLPMLAKKLKLDPALMATPILTTVTDAASILVYFTLTMNILGDRL